MIKNYEHLRNCIVIHEDNQVEVHENHIIINKSYSLIVNISKTE